MRLENEKFDIIVIAGQSNAEGYGIGEVTEEYIPNERILWLNDKSNPRFEKNADGKDVFTIDYPAEITVTVADEPIAADGQKKGKLAFFFAKGYAAEKLASDRKLLIVNAAVGGTGFARNEWGTEGAILYNRLKDFVRYALGLNKENRLVAFLWHQGECDSFENADWTPEKKYVTHKKNLESMLADFRKEFTCEKIPFIAGGFCNEWYVENKTACDGVLKAIREVCAAQGAFIETSDLKSNNQSTGNGDGLHFCREAAHILGQRYYEAYKKLVK